MTTATNGGRSPIEQARAYIAAIPGAVSEQGGHSAAYAVASRLVQDFNLPDDTALDLMQEWNATCSPPWTEKELRHKIEDARKNIDPARVGSKLDGNHARHDDTRDVIERWAALRAFSPASVRAMGAKPDGASISVPMFIKGRQVGVNLRHADGSPFAHGGKTHTPKGAKLGLFLSEAARASIPNDRRVCIAEGLPNGCAIVDAGEVFVVAFPQAPGPWKLIPEIQRLLAQHGGPVVFFSDAGKAGGKLADRLAEALATVGVEVLHVPGLPKRDLDERLRGEPNRRAVLAALIENAIPWRASNAEDATGSGDGPRQLTDLGNAERFRDQHKGKVSFDVRAGRWRVWNGQRWALDQTGEVMRLRTRRHGRSTAKLRARRARNLPMRWRAGPDVRNHAIGWRRWSRLLNRSTAWL
jgi:hypothetical protein